MSFNDPLSPIRLQLMWDRLIAVVEEQAALEHVLEGLGRVERIVLPDFGGHHTPSSAPAKKAGSPARKTFRSFGGRRGR